MTFQHGGHGCLGVGGILGAFGIHLPEHHLPNLPKPGSFPHPIRDAIHNALGGGSGGMSGGHPDPGESAWFMGGDQPMNLIFGDPVAAEAHHYSLAAIPVGGGVTMSIVALIMVIALTLIVASMMVKTVAVRTVRHVGRHRQVDLSTTEVQAVRC